MIRRTRTALVGVTAAGLLAACGVQGPPSASESTATPTAAPNGSNAPSYSGADAASEKSDARADARAREKAEAEARAKAKAKAKAEAEAKAKAEAEAEAARAEAEAKAKAEAEAKAKAEAEAEKAKAEAEAEAAAQAEEDKATKPPSNGSSAPTAPEKAPASTTLRPGDSGPAVLALQQRLSSLGYWLGTPDSTYGGLTVQAVMALQGSAGLGRDGIAGPRTRAALEQGVRPPLHGGPANRVEIDIARQVLIVVRGGGIKYVLHTSTGSGQEYESSSGAMAIATTPPGSYSVFRYVDGWDEAKLGTLYRPRYFNGGIAVHGLGSVPGYPASHGCARVTNAAMDLIWAQNLMPIGSAVVVH